MAPMGSHTGLMWLAHKALVGLTQVSWFSHGSNGLTHGVLMGLTWLQWAHTQCSHGAHMAPMGSHRVLIGLTQVSWCTQGSHGSHIIGYWYHGANTVFSWGSHRYHGTHRVLMGLTL